MNRLLTTEKMAEMLATSRESCDRSQKYMAKAMGKAIGTIQNWEYGVSAPNLLETMEWFEILGINPMRYMLDFLHPEMYKELTAESPTDDIRRAVIHWFADVSSDSDIRKIAYCIFGNTGSSFSGQLDAWCALNHLPLMDRINVADVVTNLYTLRKMRDELRGNDHIMPDVDNLSNCIYQAKKAVLNMKDDYSNIIEKDYHSR